MQRKYDMMLSRLANLLVYLQFVDNIRITVLSKEVLQGLQEIALIHWQYREGYTGTASGSRHLY